MRILITLFLVALAGLALADPIPNDTCDNAYYLIDQGFTSFDVDLCEFANDYAGCGDLVADGPDAVWRATVQTGDQLQLVATPLDDDFLPTMYLINDCDDAVGSCVIASEGDANQQTIDFTVTTPGLYFLIVDAVQGCGRVHVEMGGVLSAELHSWSAVKALY